MLAGREGRATRFHTFLTGTDETVTRTYECRVEDRGARTVELGSRQVSTRLMAESCNSTDQQFVNLYWVDDGDGRIVLSRQWTGDYLGGYLAEGGRFAVLIGEIRQPLVMTGEGFAVLWVSGHDLAGARSANPLRLFPKKRTNCLRLPRILASYRDFAGDNRFPDR
ncbi:YjbF family lipoprotein [Jhaorihella thermophila]